jgi:hypothetical protein
MVMAALIALGGVIVSGIVSFVVAHLKLATENRLEIASYRAIRRLLRQNPWDLRTFDALRRHLPGFADDELRRLLVAAGAVAFHNEKGEELWGLIKTNKSRLKHKPFEQSSKRKTGIGGGRDKQRGAAFDPALSAAPLLAPALQIRAAADGPTPRAGTLALSLANPKQANSTRIPAAVGSSSHRRRQRLGLV